MPLQSVLRRSCHRPLAMIRLLTPADFRSMPWKNGAGSTMEIAAHPPETGLDRFAWRVSLADVERDGPFSRFPGVDRTLVLVEGAGMRLRGSDGLAELTTPFVPHAFSGDDAIECTLVAGHCRDFNAMFRRGRARGQVAVLRNGGAAIAPERFRLAYAATGAHLCAVSGCSALRLEAGNALLIDASVADESPPLEIRAAVPGSVALVVSIDCP